MVANLAVGMLRKYVEPESCMSQRAGESSDLFPLKRTFVSHCSSSPDVREANYSMPPMNGFRSWRNDGELGRGLSRADSSAF
jgi:hypothetical protein